MTRRWVFADLDRRTELAFMAIEPVRAADRLQRALRDHRGNLSGGDDAPYFEVAQLDRPEVRIAVGGGGVRSVYRARCSRRSWCGRPPPRRSRCFSNGLEAAAVRQPLLAAAAAHPGYRVLEGAFHRHPPSDGGAAAKTQGAAYVKRFYRALQSQRLVRGGLAAQRRGE